MSWKTLISMSENSHYHIPVLLKECIEGLEINPAGVYVDVTFGGGGHSAVILENLDQGRLIAFDQDADALRNVPSDDRFLLIGQNFRFMKNNLKIMGVGLVDGILADLGVSSHQFNEGKRGFSIRFDGELDMRMNSQSKVSAKDLVNECAEGDLADVFYKYGEIRNSRLLAKKIVEARVVKRINTVFELREIAESCSNKKNMNQYLAQVFQALRIEVNDEMKALEELLVQSVDMLKPGGRLVVMSYHSLEDRLVKNFMRKGKFSGEEEKDLYGNILRPLQPINNKVMVPGELEIKDNNRARSAKLRIAEKLK
jgi:16S rRNA (cytosine1402-N4)-methyltransferase